MLVEYENETLPKNYRKIESILFSSKFSCPESGFTIEEIEPRLFSFNSPYGACEECEGIGSNLNVDPKLVIPDEKKVFKMALYFHGQNQLPYIMLKHYHLYQNTINFRLQSSGKSYQTKLRM